MYWICVWRHSLTVYLQLCFSVCIVIWAIVGFFIGQIRSLKVRIYGVILTCTDGLLPQLQSYGWLANGAVW